MKRLCILAATIFGVIGNSTTPEWPSLAGIGADYIAEQLKNFKDGKRVSPVMAANAMSLSADDMADLGAYFDGLTNTGLEADPSYWQGLRACSPSLATPAPVASCTPSYATA